MISLVPDTERLTYTSCKKERKKRGESHIYPANFFFELVTGLEEDEKAKSPWYVFNDFLVKRIRPQETTSFKGLWKVRLLRKKVIHIEFVSHLNIISIDASCYPIHKSGYG